MKYELLEEDEQVFKMRHPDGSEFSVAKNAVGPSVHKKIRSYGAKDMFDGGIVMNDEEKEPAEPDYTATATEPLQIEPVYDAAQSTSQPLIVEREPEYVRQPAQDVILPDAQAPVSQTPAPQVAPTTLSPETAAYAQAFQQKEAGITQMAQAQADAGAAQAKIYEEQAKQVAEQQRQFQEQHAKLDVEHKQLVDAVINQKIDPNRLYNSMSTGNKILAAISVALSGFGAGLQGPGAKNQAMEILQREIDRDIDAQKADLGKKSTLLSENMRQYGNLQTAMQATQLQLNAITQAKISRVAATANSVQAKAQALMLLGELGLQAVEIKKKIAQDQALQSIARGGGASDAQIQQLPKEVRERAVKIGGKYALAIDDNSAKEARKVIGANDSMMGNLDKLIALREKFGAEFVPNNVKAEMKTIAASLQLAIKEAKSLGTLDKGAEAFLEKLVADPTSVGFVSDQYRALRSTQEREAAAKLRSLGVNIGGAGSESAPQYKTVNGKKYMRGPNGEAIEVR